MNSMSIVKARTSESTATERVSALEARVRALRAERVELIAKAPAASNREIALVDLGESGAKMPTSADLAEHDDALRHIDARVIGLLELLAEEELLSVAEKIAAADAKMKEIAARHAPLVARIEEQRREIELLEREASDLLQDRAHLGDIRHRFDIIAQQVKRGEKCSYFDYLFNKWGFAPDLRAATLLKFKDPVAAWHARGAQLGERPVGVRE